MFIPTILYRVEPLLIIMLVSQLAKMEIAGAESQPAGEKRLQLTSEGDLILVAMFPMTISKKQNDSSSQTKCSAFGLGLRLAEAFRYAVHVANSVEMLQGITLGYEIRDTCSRIDTVVKIALDVNDRVRSEGKFNESDGVQVNKTIGVVGAGKSELSISVNNILSATDIPQVSYASTSRFLSNKDRFPTFARTIPTDTLQAKVIAQLLEKFGWTYVTLVYSDDNYGRPLAASLISYSEPKGICFADVVKLRRQVGDTDLQDVVNGVKRQDKANIIVVFLNSIISERLVRMARLNNVERKIWIFTATWFNSKSLLEENIDFLDGSIGVVDEIIAVPDLAANTTYRQYKKDSNESTKSVAETTAASGLPLLGGRPLELQFAGITKVPYVMNAVLAFVNAVKVFCKKANLVMPHECQKAIRPVSIIPYLRNITFKGVNGHDVYLDQNGDPMNNNIELYSVIAGNHMRLSRVGFYTGFNDTLAVKSQDEFIKQGNLSRFPTSTCSLPCAKGYYTVANVMLKCCWQCVLCPAGQISNRTSSHGCTPCRKGTKPNTNRTQCTIISYRYLRWTDSYAIFISIISVLISVVGFIFLVLFIRFRDTPVVRASDREFSWLLLLSFILGLLLPVMYPGLPTSFRCRSQEILPNVAYTLSLSLIIARVNRTALIFNTKRVSGLQKLFVRRSMQVSLVVFLTSTQLIICLLWLSSRPPYVKETPYPEHRLISCHVNSVTYFLLSKSILLLLSFTCIAMTLSARHIPYSYNNARHILFALLTFKVTWLIAIIGRFYGDSGSIVDSLTIFISYSFLLFTMFAPKIYILLLRKDLNTPSVLRERAWAFTLKKQRRSLGSLQFSVSTLEQLGVHNCERDARTGSVACRDIAVQTDWIFL